MDGKSVKLEIRVWHKGLSRASPSERLWSDVGCALGERRGDCLGSCVASEEPPNPAGSELSTTAPSPVNRPGWSLP